MKTNVETKVVTLQTQIEELKQHREDVDALKKEIIDLQY